MRTSYVSAWGRGNYQAVGWIAGALVLLLALLTTLVPQMTLMHETAQIVIADALRQELMAYCVPEDVATRWAFGAIQPGPMRVTVSSTKCQPAVLPVVPRTGGTTVLPEEFGVASLVINGEHFGIQTVLGSGGSDFFPAAAPYAAELHQLTGIPTSVILAQWANETAFGQALYGWNFGNIKDFRTDASGRTYMVYTSPDAGVRAEAQLLLGNSRYAPLLGQSDPAAAAAAWGQSGWAASCYDIASSGGDWAGDAPCSSDTSGAGTMLTSLITQFNLKQYDVPSPPLAGDDGRGMFVALPQIPTNTPPTVVQQIQWALNPANNANFPDNTCESFVEAVLGHKWQAPTAAAAESGPTFHQTTDLASVPVGAAIYFAPSPDNAMAACPSGCGHAAIYLGNGVMLSTSADGVKPISVSWWQAHSAPFVGWRTS